LHGLHARLACVLHVSDFEWRRVRVCARLDGCQRELLVIFMELRRMEITKHRKAVMCGSGVKLSIRN
jgi:hypothetical protein